MRASILTGLSLLAVALIGSPRARASEPFLTDLDDARAMARATGKPIFLDAYTTWCAPCRRMDAEVFSRPEVRALLTRDFVPLRLDMEHAAGQQLGDRFAIRSYPTVLVFDADGEWHRATGFLDAAELTAFAKTALDPSANYRALHRRYRAGERDVALLTILSDYARQAHLRERADYDYALMRASGDWTSEDASLRLLESPQHPASPLFDSLVARRIQVAAVYGAPVVDERIARLLDDALFGALPAKPRTARRLIARTYPASADSVYLRYRMRRAREAGRAKAFGRAAIASQRRYPSSSPDELDELIYLFDERLRGWKTAEVDAWRQRRLALSEAP